MTAHWPQPDFLGSRRRIPVLAWVWAATGALVLAVSVTEVVVRQQGIDEQVMRLAKATQRLAKATPVRASQLPMNVVNVVNVVNGNPASDNSKGEADAIRAAQRVLTQIGHPWGQILTTVEAETPTGLQWLLFDHASDSPDLRLEGQAPDVSTVLQLVNTLSVRPGWSGVALTRLQAPDPRDANAAAAPARWRFEINAVVDAQRISDAPFGAGG